MAVTRITASRDAGAALNYVSRPKGKSKERVLAVSGSNVDVKHASEQMSATREAYNKNQVNPRTGEKYIQVYRLIQSFSDEELDPDNPDDVEKCNRLGYELAHEAYPDHEVLIVTHGDGVGGKLHNHLIINAVSFETGKQLRGDKTYWPWISKQSDSVLEKNGMQPIDQQNTSKDLRTQAERKLADKGKYVWKDDLKDRIQNVLTDEKAVDRDAFVKLMGEVGVDVKYHGEKAKNGVTYAFKDNNGKQQKTRSTRLGADYQRESIDVILNENKAVKETSNEVVAPPVNSPSRNAYDDFFKDFTFDFEQMAKEQEEKRERQEIEAQRRKEEQVRQREQLREQQKQELLKQQQEAKLRKEREEKEKQRQADEAKKQQEELRRRKAQEEMIERRKKFLEKDVTRVQAITESTGRGLKVVGYEMPNADEPWKKNEPLSKEQTKWYKEYKETKRQERATSVQRDHGLER